MLLRTVLSECPREEPFRATNDALALQTLIIRGAFLSAETIPSLKNIILPDQPDLRKWAKSTDSEISCLCHLKEKAYFEHLEPSTSNAW